MARFKYYRYGTTKECKLPRTGWIRSEKDYTGKYISIEVYDRMFRDSDVTKYGLDDLNEPVKKLTKYRSAAGYTQIELADLVGIPARTLQSWETKGMNKATLDVAIKTADILKCSVYDLIEDEN